MSDIPSNIKNKLLLLACPPHSLGRNDGCWAILDFEDSIHRMLVSCSDSFVEWSEKREGSLANPGHREIGSGWSCGALIVLKVEQKNHNEKL